MSSTTRYTNVGRTVRRCYIRCLFLCGSVSFAALLTLVQSDTRTRAQPPANLPVPSDQILAQGKQVYVTNCAACHGERGDGKGPMARFLYPRPRNFGEGKFRIVTTVNGKPSDDDLLLVLNRGMSGSAMFPFAHLPEADKKALLVYLRQLTRESFVEFAKQQAEAMDDVADVEELKLAAVTILKPGEAVAVPADLPAYGNDSIARGAKLYATSCAACHGATGKGDGVQAQKNDDGMATRPRDLTRGFFKGTRDPKQLYARIWQGMPGSPMPGSNQVLKPGEVGDLVNFLLSLSTPEASAKVEHKRTSLVVRRAEGALPEDGAATAWDRTVSTNIVLTPLWWRDHDDPNFQVAALHDGKTLAVRLTWRDATANTTLARPEDFVDMAAVQFYRGKPEPFLGMGAEKSRVDLWLWRAGTVAQHAGKRGPSDEYPFDGPIYNKLTQGKGKSPDFATARAAGNPNAAGRDATNLAAQGGGSSTQLPAVSQFVTAKANWKDGQWTVVLRRPMQIPQDGLALEPGRELSVAFAIWDGAARDRNGQKFVSIWHDLKIE